jgi:hypothetical protein
MGGFIVAFLLAALMWFLWIAPDLACGGLLALARRRKKIA